MKRFIHLFQVLTTMLLIGSLHPVWADRGALPMRPITMKENINVFDTGQKAIICWDKGEELLILSTDKHASAQVKVLEFMPLPSKPSRVEENKEPCFEGVAQLIEAHRPKVALEEEHAKRGNSPSARVKDSREEQAVQIVFHKKIGAHDITVAKVLHMNGFCDWVKKFYTLNQLQYRPEDVNRLSPVVSDYLQRGYGYFVFDAIELTEENKSIAPILYQFKSRDLYFPLKVTTLSEGETNIALYLFTHFKTDIWGTKTGFKSAFYTVGGSPSYGHPVKFEVTREEAGNIAGEIRSFMGQGGTLWFSTAIYKGSTKKLLSDFLLKRASMVGLSR